MSKPSADGQPWSDGGPQVSSPVGGGLATLDSVLSDVLDLVDSMEPVDIVPSVSHEDPYDPPTNPTRANLEFVKVLRVIRPDTPLDGEPSSRPPKFGVGGKDAPQNSPVLRVPPPIRPVPTAFEPNDLPTPAMTPEIRLLEEAPTESPAPRRRHLPAPPTPVQFAAVSSVASEPAELGVWPDADLPTEAPDDKVSWLFPAILTVWLIGIGVLAVFFLVARWSWS